MTVLSVDNDVRTSATNERNERNERGDSERLDMIGQWCFVLN